MAHAKECSAAAFGNVSLVGPKVFRSNQEGRVTEFRDADSALALLEADVETLECEVDISDPDDPGLTLWDVDTLSVTLNMAGGGTVSLSFADMMYIGSRNDSGFRSESRQTLRFRKQFVAD